MSDLSILQAVVALQLWRSAFSWLSRLSARPAVRIEAGSMRIPHGWHPAHLDERHLMAGAR